MDNTIFTVLKLLGSLALLMYGMKVMSEGLQKLTGDRLRNILGAMTTNRFTGLLTGAFVTAAVQSSTATTVMTVSFVNAGLLTLTQAISVIMGANIGTTVTAWIMSVFGFQFNMSNVIYLFRTNDFAGECDAHGPGTQPGTPVFYRILQGMGNVFRTVVPADRRHYNNGGTVISGRYGYYINIMFKRRIRPVSGYCAGDGREHRNDGNLQYRGSHR